MTNAKPISRQLQIIAQDLAGIPTAQKAINKVYNDMIQANEPESRIILTMTGIIADGLGYGNWPKI